MAKTRITITINIYYDSYMAVKKNISKRKVELLEESSSEETVFSHTFSIWKKNYHSVARIYQLIYFGIFKMEFPLLEACLPAYSFVAIDIIMPVCTAVLDTFQPISCDVLSSIIHKLNRTTCGLDPFPTKLLMSHLSSIINIILRIVNLCFLPGVFPASCKSAIIIIMFI